MICMCESTTNDEEPIASPCGHRAHVSCKTCFERHVDNAVKGGDAGFGLEGVPCPHHPNGCSGTGLWKATDLVGKITPSLVARLSKSHDRLVWERGRIAGMQLERERVAAEQRLNNDPVERAIVDVQDLAVSKCPKCKCVFDVRDGCMAMMCEAKTDANDPNAKCGLHFCAFCLCGFGCDEQVHGVHAHLHVMACPYNPNPGDMFGQPHNNANEHAMKRAARDRVQKRLRALDEDVRARVEADARVVETLASLEVGVAAAASTSTPTSAQATS